jgi:serine/threonine-protein kinase
MVGHTISHYKILEKLGEGGMGVVYRAEDTKLKRTVALKFLPHGLHANEAERARFLQEAQAASALNHTNICTIYDIGEEGGQQFIVMEYIDGKTLREIIQSAIPNHQSAISYAIQIGEALQEAHGKGIVHRDIKTDNIMVNAKNQIKVMDFGLAKLKGSLKLTKTSSTVGTLAYMAPEQIEGGEVDARSDIFSFGVVLYEMLTGHMPFRGEHEAAMVYSIVNEEPMPIQNELPDISSELVHILNRALEKDPEDRYQFVHEMVIDLRRLRKSTTRVSRVSSDQFTSSQLSSTKAEGVESSVRTQASSSLRKWILVAAAFVVLVAVILFWYLGPSKGTGTIDSIAILPFINVNADPDMEFLSDGVTESVINSLSRLQTLRVVPRSSAFFYKGKSYSPQEVGKELKVRAVLTGRVIQRGDNMNIQAELVDVQMQSQIWGEQYNRKVADLLSVQEEISMDIAAKLHQQLSGEDKKKLQQRSTEDSEAFRLYLQGSYFWNKRSGQSMKKSLEYFNRAIEKDPTFALAYSGIADAYITLGDWQILPPKDSYPKAKAAAKKALEQDENLGEALTALAFIADEYDWNWPEAERLFQRAIALNPSYPTAHQWYAEFLMHAGRFQQSLQEFERAKALDPLSLIINSVYGLGLATSGRIDDAIQQLNSTLEMDPAFIPAHKHLQLIYALHGMMDKSFEEYLKVDSLQGASQQHLKRLRDAYASRGLTNPMQLFISIVLEASKTRYIPPSDLAIGYGCLGQKEQAFEWLERVVEERSYMIFYTRFWPGWEELRKDPRYRSILAKTGVTFDDNR